MGKLFSERLFTIGVRERICCRRRELGIRLPPGRFSLLHRDRRHGDLLRRGSELPHRNNGAKYRRRSQTGSPHERSLPNAARHRLGLGASLRHGFPYIQAQRGPIDQRQLGQLRNIALQVEEVRDRVLVWQKGTIKW